MPYGSESWMIVDGNNNLGLNYYSGGNVIIARSGGSVGVGTTSPSSKLHVDGNVRVENDLLFSDNIEITGPAGRFFSYTNTGIDADNNIRFRPGGGTSDAMRITSDSNVGIGTTSPARRLHVNGNTRLDGNLRVDGSIRLVNDEYATIQQGSFTDGLSTSVGSTEVAMRTRHSGTAGSNNVAQIWHNNGGTTIYDRGSHTLHVTDSGSRRVGIRTTNPSANLHVVGNSRITGNTRIDGGIDSRGVLNMRSNNIRMDYESRIELGSSNNYIRTGDDSNNWVHVESHEDNGVALNHFSNGRVALASGGGNVGVGTNSPSSKLHVDGSFRLGSGTSVDTIATSRGTSNNRLLTQRAVDDNYVRKSGDTMTGRLTVEDNIYGEVVFAEGSGGSTFIQHGGSTGFIGTHQNTDLRLGTNNGAEAMRIKTSGMVGIGTTSPDRRLHVQGSFYADNIYGGYSSTSTPAANIVLRNGYLWRESSSERYKENIQPLQINTSQILALQPKQWTDIESNERGYGLIAEEVEELGLTDLVGYNETGAVESIHYNRISVHLLGVVQEQQETIQYHEQTTQEQQERIETLEAENQAIKESLCNLGEEQWC